MGEAIPGWMTTRRDTEGYLTRSPRAAITVENEGEWRVNYGCFTAGYTPTGVMEAAILSGSSSRRFHSV